MSDEKRNVVGLGVTLTLFFLAMFAFPRLVAREEKKLVAREERKKRDR